MQDARMELIKRSDSGDADASFILGMMYFAGQGVPESFAEAVQWWRTAADQGSPQAKIMLILTLGCKDDATLNRCEPDESAVRQYIETAERGDANAQFRLGELYLQGRGITQDSQRAFKWLSTAGAQMHDFAGIFLGLLFNLGICLLQCEPKDAGWFKKEYEENEANSRFYDILRTCGLRGCAGYVEAFMWLNFGLEFGYHDAEKYCCLLKKEMSQEQIAEAFYRLGYWLYEGCFVKTDHKKAYDSFLKSAKLGNVLGKNYVGACYENAIGVIKDYDKAFYWYTQAADEGNADALNQLSLMYEYGHGVPVDKSESQRLLEKAATLGSDFAIVRMKENQDANPTR